MTGGAAQPERKIGLLLLDQGCRQGAILETPARLLWLGTGTRADLATHEETLPDCGLVVASQDCDIKAEPEPFVEAVVARWTDDSREMLMARKGNSSRLFALRDEKTRVLVADARRRVQFEKTTLHDAHFSTVLPDSNARARFARWLGGRYDRPAIPDDLVDAICKPVVKAVEAALKKKTSPILPVLNDRVNEIRFRVREQTPLAVDLVVMVEDRAALSVEDEAELNAWLEEALVTDGGPVHSILITYRDERSISLHDYMETLGLSLEHFSE